MFSCGLSLEALFILLPHVIFESFCEQKRLDWGISRNDSKDHSLSLAGWHHDVLSQTAQVCAPAVADISHLATASAAFKSSTAVLQTLADEQEQSRFCELIPLMLQV